jgi:hypothetical protein
LCFEFTSEGLLAILHSDGITAFCIGRDVDVEANDVASIDGFLIDGFACRKLTSETSLEYIENQTITLNSELNPMECFWWKYGKKD